MRRPRKVSAMNVNVLLHTNAKLVQIVQALATPCRTLARLHRRKQSTTKIPIMASTTSNSTERKAFR